MEWIVPCNLKMYDVFGAFDSLGKVDWKQTNKNVEKGDIVYIYVGKPISAIVFKCVVNKANIHVYEIDDSAFAKNGENFENTAITWSWR